MKSVKYQDSILSIKKMVLKDIVEDLDKTIKMIEENKKIVSEISFVDALASGNGFPTKTITEYDDSSQIQLMTLRSYKDQFSEMLNNATYDNLIEYTLEYLNECLKKVRAFKDMVQNQNTEFVQLQNKIKERGSIIEKAGENSGSSRCRIPELDNNKDADGMVD